MSYLKIIKLHFYCNAECIDYFGEELITDKFEAWVHGPVSRKVYDNLKGESILYSDISYSEKEEENVDEEFNKLTEGQRDLVRSVLDDLSTWTGLELEAATHHEKPWQEARYGYSEGDKCHKLISKETTKLFYKSEIDARI